MKIIGHTNKNQIYADQQYIARQMQSKQHHPTAVNNIAKDIPTATAAKDGENLENRKTALKKTK